MKKSFLFIFLMIFLFFNGFSGLAMAQESNQITTSSSVASFVKIKSAGGFINDVKNLLKETWQKVTTSKRGGAVNAWFAQRKQAVQNGWQEEKQEFRGNIKEIIAKAWQKAKDKIKSWVFHKKS